MFHQRLVTTVSCVALKTKLFENRTIGCWDSNSNIFTTVTQDSGTKNRPIRFGEIMNCLVSERGENLIKLYQALIIL